MNEYSLAELLEEVHLREFAEFDKPPRHFFSLRHRREMNKILYPHTLSASTEKRRIPTKKRVLIALLVIILSMIGIAAGAAMSKSFAIWKDGSYSELYAVYDNNAPATLETLYLPTAIPDGYYLSSEKREPNHVFNEYYDSSAEKFFFFYQGVKNGFSIEFYDGGDLGPGNIEEMNINGNPACYICDDINYGAIVWDNSDYILEVGGCLTKDELIALAESVEPKID